MTTQTEVASELARCARFCQNPLNAATSAQCEYLAALLIDRGDWDRHGINSVTSGHNRFQLTKRAASQLIDDLNAPRPTPAAEGPVSTVTSSVKQYNLEETQALARAKTDEANTAWLEQLANLKAPTELVRPANLFQARAMRKHLRTLGYSA